jgi:hypothetical protein
MDRGALRPCGIVTEDVPASPASVGGTINQAAEASCQKKIETSDRNVDFRSLIFCLLITRLSTLHNFRNIVVSNQLLLS